MKHAFISTGYNLAARERNPLYAGAWAVALVATLSVTLPATLMLSGTAQAKPSVDPVEQRGTVIRDRFMAAIKSCGVQPTFEPA